MMYFDEMCHINPDNVLKNNKQGFDTKVMICHV